MRILYNAILNGLLLAGILKSKLQMWLNEKKKKKHVKRDFK